MRNRRSKPNLSGGVAFSVLLAGLLVAGCGSSNNNDLLNPPFFNTGFASATATTGTTGATIGTATTGITTGITIPGLTTGSATTATTGATTAAATTGTATTASTGSTTATTGTATTATTGATSAAATTGATTTLLPPPVFTTGSTTAGATTGTATTATTGATTGSATSATTGGSVSGASSFLNGFVFTSLTLPFGSPPSAVSQQTFPAIGQIAATDNVTVSTSGGTIHESIVTLDTIFVSDLVLGVPGQSPIIDLNVANDPGVPGILSDNPIGGVLGSRSFTVNITVPPGLAPGSYSLSLGALEGGVIPFFIRINLTVVPPQRSATGINIFQSVPQ